MTEQGEAFVARMSVVTRMVAAGTSPFAAMAAGLEDADWDVVFAAARTMVSAIKAQDVIAASKFRSPPAFGDPQ